MNKHHTPLLLLALLLSLSACDNRQQQIEKSAQGYLDAMGNYLIDEAYPYATRHTREQTLPVLAQLTERTNPDYIKSNTPATITLQRTVMLSDTSARVYYHKHTPIKELDDSVTLLREDGEWLVDVHIRPLPFSVGNTSPRPSITDDSIVLGGRKIAQEELLNARKVKSIKKVK